jgi:predicted HTH domain antitoxin
MIRSMSVAVSLPEEVATLAKCEGGELDHAVVEAVVFYHYERGRLSAGKAAKLLGVSRLAFEDLRMANGVDRPFTDEELEQELKWANQQFG